MTVKNIVFRTSQRLNKIVAAKIKKSHIYELFAAAFNFNTYAALGSKIIFIEYDEPLTENLVDQLKIRTRCIELGYSESDASLISTHLPIIIAEERLATLNLNDLIAVLRSYSGEIDIWSEALPSSKWTVDEWLLPELIVYAVHCFGMCTKHLINIPMLPLTEQVHIQFAQLWCKTVGVKFGMNIIVAVSPLNLVMGGYKFGQAKPFKKISALYTLQRNPLTFQMKCRIACSG